MAPQSYVFRSNLIIQIYVVQANTANSGIIML
jgi:hypothetical protein